MSETGQKSIASQKFDALFGGPDPEPAKEATTLEPVKESSETNDEIDKLLHDSLAGGERASGSRK